MPHYKNESDTANLLISDENGERKLLAPGEEYTVPDQALPSTRKKKESKKEEGE